MIVSRAIPHARNLSVIARRNFGASTVLLQTVADPIQQLFVNKIREYGEKAA